MATSFQHALACFLRHGRFPWLSSPSPRDGFGQSHPWPENGLALQAKASSAGRTERPGPNDGLVGGREEEGCQEAKEGPRCLCGGDTYPDCGEPLVVQFIAPWGRKKQRSWYLKKSCVCPQEFLKLLSACRTWKVQNLGNHVEAPMHHSLKEFLPQVSFLKVRSDPISAPSTNPNPPPCLLDRSRAP